MSWTLWECVDCSQVFSKPVDHCTQCEGYVQRLDEPVFQLQ